MQRLEASGCEPLARSNFDPIFAHYQELRIWASRVALVGAGEAETIIERHYAESLRATPLVGGVRTAVDLGSGAGFPGLILAAARPEVEFWLFESRGKKAAFLRTAAAKAKLSCRVVGARVSRRQPAAEAVKKKSIELVTVRGVKIDKDTWDGLWPALADGARILRWEGSAKVAPWPDAKPGRTLELGGRGRKVQEWLYSARGDR